MRLVLQVAEHLLEHFPGLGDKQDNSRNRLGVFTISHLQICQSAEQVLHGRSLLDLYRRRLSCALWIGVSEQEAVEQAVLPSSRRDRLGVGYFAKSARCEIRSAA